MKKFILFFLSINCFVFSFENSYFTLINKDYKFSAFNNFQCSVYDTSNDNVKLKKKIDNIIFKDIDISWFKQKYRMEKLFIAVGIINMVVGTPILMSGLISYFIPNTDVTETSFNTNVVLMGVGSGVMTVGLSFTIAGSSIMGFKKYKDKKVLEKVPDTEASE